jgi:hypothetical protein
LFGGHGRKEVSLVEVGVDRLTVRRKLTIAGDMHLLDLSQVKVTSQLYAKITLLLFKYTSIGWSHNFKIRKKTVNRN